MTEVIRLKLSAGEFVLRTDEPAHALTCYTDRTGSSRSAEVPWDELATFVRSALVTLHSLGMLKDVESDRSGEPFLRL